MLIYEIWRLGSKLRNYLLAPKRSPAGVAVRNQETTLHAFFFFTTPYLPIWMNRYRYYELKDDDPPHAAKFQRLLCRRGPGSPRLSGWFPYLPRRPRLTN